MASLIMLLLFVAGPLVVLGIWLWLRSRRDPVALVEPLEIGRVFSSGFRVFGSDGWPVVALAAVFVGLPQILSVAVTKPMMLARSQELAAASPGDPFALFKAMATVPFMIGMVIGFALMMVFYVASTIYLVSRYEGAPVTIGEALARSPARAAIAFGALIVAVIGIGIGWMLFLLPGIILSLNWMLLVPVISCEDAGFFGSFARSRSLAIGSRGRILVLFLLYIVAVILLSIPGGALGGALTGRPAATPGLFGSIWTVVLGVLLAAFQTGFFAGLYVELRRIRDGMARPALSDVFA
jgi:hypothetical protein